ncbi:MAG: hypothetical protein GVY29_09250 [Spirochaetes bacterium]|jgi:uncharacterized damage-inducible protein DinB|nr:hypothetical protein [Spirochaetota bacterium]
MSEQSLLREHLREAIQGHGAHISFAQAIHGFPYERAGERVPSVPHSAWDLVYHMGLVLQDLIDWVIAEEYRPHEYPSGYWPADHAPESADDWRRAVSEVERRIDIMKSWIDDGANNLLEALERNPAHTPARQILLAIDHNSYHIGQLVDLRMLLGIPVRDW